MSTSGAISSVLIDICLPQVLWLVRLADISGMSSFEVRRHSLTHVEQRATSCHEVHEGSEWLRGMADSSGPGIRARRNGDGGGRKSIYAPLPSIPGPGLGDNLTLD